MIDLVTLKRLSAGLLIGIFALLIAAAIFKAIRVGEELALLRAENAALRQQVTLYRANDEKLDAVQAAADVCLQKLSESEAIAQRWAEEIDRLQTEREAVDVEAVVAEADTAVVGDDTRELVTNAVTWLRRLEAEE